MLESNKSSRSVVQPLEAGSSRTRSLGLAVSPGKAVRGGLAGVPHTGAARSCHIDASAVPALCPSGLEVKFENARARPGFCEAALRGPPLVRRADRGVVFSCKCVSTDVEFTELSSADSVGSARPLWRRHSRRLWDASLGPPADALRPGLRGRPGEPRAAGRPPLCPAVRVRHP